MRRGTRSFARGGTREATGSAGAKVPFLCMLIVGRVGQILGESHVVSARSPHCTLLRTQTESLLAFLCFSSRIGSSLGARMDTSMDPNAAEVPQAAPSAPPAAETVPAEATVSYFQRPRSPPKAFCRRNSLREESRSARPSLTSPPLPPHLQAPKPADPVANAPVDTPPVAPEAPAAPAETTEAAPVADAMDTDATAEDAPVAPPAAAPAAAAEAPAGAAAASPPRTPPRWRRTRPRPRPPAVPSAVAAATPPASLAARRRARARGVY